MDALVKLGSAIELALAEAPVADVLSILTGAFVGLTTEVVRRQGHDESKEIKVEGGQRRDITIHPEKTKTEIGLVHSSSLNGPPSTMSACKMNSMN